MADLKDWIEEQESLMIVAGAQNGNEAIKLLEHGETNRDLSAKQAKRHVIAQTLAEAYGLSFYLDLLDDCEHAQLHIENQGRKDYMRTVIEPWQGKINAKKDAIKAIV